MKTIEQITQTDRQKTVDSFEPAKPIDAIVRPGCDETLIDRWLLCCNRQAPSAEVFGRGILWLVLLVWGLVMITGPVEKGWCTFLHNIDLPIHETGHLLFTPFGRFMHFLGGSIFQILMPAILAGAFLIYKRDAFAAAVMTWWTGQNFLDVASYINDARAMSANLVGDNIHDWNWLLGHMGRLHQDRQIAAIVFGIGAMIMILSVIWSGWILWLQTSNRIYTQKAGLN